MAVNKVVYGTTVLVDLTEDTVTPAALLQGRTAHGKDGELITGTLDPGGEVFDPAPWKEIVVGTITPSAATSRFSADLSKGTPMGLIISLISTGNVSATSNALISCAWSNNKIEPSTYGKGTAYYSSATNRTTTGTYPVYSNGSWNLSKSLRAGWTYYYCIIYG